MTDKVDALLALTYLLGATSAGCLIICHWRYTRLADEIGFASMLATLLAYAIYLAAAREAQKGRGDE